MGLMRKTTIVVPCYNEAKRINREAFLEEALRERNLSFLFVNDGSGDETLKMLDGLKRANAAQISFMSLEKNSGKAEAVRQGMLKAIGRGDFNIGYWDADLATPLEEIKNFCDILDRTEATLVMGSRVKLLGRKIDRRASRHYLGRLFATFASFMLRIPVYDTQCGAKIFKNTQELKAAFDKPFKVKWTFDVELFARFSIIGSRKGNNDFSRTWVEYPVEKWEDVKGSKIRKRDFVKGGYEFIKVFFFLHSPVIKRHYERYLLQ
jgi:glycosyltransferase involved in cell wall biosynthesis